MIHSLYRPKAPLDAFVDYFWVSGRYAALSQRERVLPSGVQDLIVHLGETPVRLYANEHAAEAADAPGAVVCGPRSSPLIIGTALGATVGAHFKPGGAHPFFGVPADALAEQTLSLESLWGASAHALRERLMETTSPLEQIHLLEAQLLQRLRHSPHRGPALRTALDAFEEPDLLSVAEVNRRTGLSPKRLLALFREEVGLSPKAYWRVRRFRAALRDLEHGDLSGAALAAEHGYFDQAHFLREFRALSGSSPREFLAARITGTDHVSVYG